MTAETEQLRARIAELEDALSWIKRIADSNYEQDTSLRARGARTLARISDRASSCLPELVQPVSKNQ